MKKLICLLLVLILTFSYAYANNQSINSFMLSNYQKALSISPLSSFNGYCAACVAYQGMAMGIHTSYVWCNGNEAFNKYSSMTQTSGGWYTKSYKASEYSMKKVLLSQNSNQTGGAYSPIVLGFKTGTASNAGQTYGHAMMIYAVRDGIVYFADSTEPVLTDNIHNLSIDDFCVRYSDKPDTPQIEFTYDGAVVFYKSAPISASINSSLNMAGLWQDITFNLSSPAATSYSIGIDRGGERITTIHTNKPYYTIAFGEEGNYTAYITACNPFGHIDSAPISFTIGQRPQNPILYADKTSAAAGETITFSYGAERATSYSVGIINPDGSLDAIHTNSSTTLQKEFYTPGVYKIFVSCCSVHGHVDTQTISFEIK